METHKKIANNNQPAGGDVREMLGAWGGHGSDPFRPDSKFGWLAALCCYKLLPPPLLGPKSTKKNSNNNQPVGGDVGWARGTSEGHGSDPLHPPSVVGQVAAPGGLRRPKHPPGPKKNKIGLLQQSKVGGGRV